MLIGDANGPFVSESWIEFGSRSGLSGDRPGRAAARRIAGHFGQFQQALDSFSRLAQLIFKTNIICKQNTWQTYFGKGCGKSYYAINI
jgi:hypothetical protein